MEGGTTVGQSSRSMEGDFRMMMESLLGLRPWKRHSLILIVAGFMYVLIGVAYILAAPDKDRATALYILLRIAPLSTWGVVFICAGIMAIVSSRWPPRSETWGYMVLGGLSMGWGSAYLVGILLANSPWTNISGFFVWELFGFLWWAISGLKNPIPIKLAVAYEDGPP